MGFSIKVVPEGDGMKVVLVLFLQMKLSFTCTVSRDVSQAWGRETYDLLILSILLNVVEKFRHQKFIADV